MPETPDFQKNIQGILESLQSFAQPRPDITSKVEKPYTYAGRVVSALDKETPESIMRRSPIGELEAGGQAAGAIPKGLLAAGMAKQFIPKPGSGVLNLAKIAPANQIPETAFEKMFPAIIDEKTGEVIHAMKVTGPGGHGALYNYMPRGFNPTRGFVDPATFYAYPEAQLEQILMKQRQLSGGQQAYFKLGRMMEGKE